jgi:hypothetical protein
MTKSFFKYSTDVEKIFEIFFLTFRIEYFVTWKNLLPHVHG